MRKKKIQSLVLKRKHSPYTLYTVRLTIEYQFTQNILTDLPVQVTTNHVSDKSFDLTGPLRCIYSVLHPKEQGFLWWTLVSSKEVCLVRPVKHYKNPHNLQNIEVTLWHLGHLLRSCSQHSGRQEMSDVVEDYGETAELLHLQKREANESNEINMPSWLSTIERSHIWDL